MAFLLKDYTDIREIARGGMGRVYIATQLSLNRKVIIKEMTAGLVTNDNEIRRFENEARAAAVLNHDNIIRIYDFGEDNSSFFIAMEYIDGPDLDAILKNSTYLPEIALMILLQALKGLHFAHQHQIIHRDIKPGNILISKVGAVKVVDFGLAHAGAQQTHLTATDMIVGTPLYMSPEQATGEEKKDIRMDIWSVGVLLYTIITGRNPFLGDNVPSILFNIVHTKEKPIEEVVPSLPADLAIAINRCLEKERTKRLLSLASVIEALQKYFFDIGIVDTAEEIRKYVVDPAACMKELSARLNGYHLSKATAHGEAGEHELEKAHLQKAKHPEQTLRQTADTEGTALGSSTRVHGKQPSGRWTPPPAVPVGPIIAGFTVVAAVLGLAGWLSVTRHRLLPATAPETLAVVTRADISSVNESAAQESTAAAVPSQPPPVMPLPAPPKKYRKSSYDNLLEQNAMLYSQSPATSTATLKVTVDPPYAAVMIDGENWPQQELSEGIPLRAGRHTIEARAAGYKSFSRTVTLKRGAVEVVSAELRIQNAD
ncbi:MAG: protein kinase [Chitinispirillaceae bacterium]|jgi:serine/threonine-protein kinase|nr:protein kinase [Chitinispirillaceae bacterium]